MHDAFLSYAREDLQLAERLEQALRTSNKDVWRDLSGIAGGEVYWNRIEDAVAASHYLLFLMTERSLQSMNCKKEIDCAVQNQKRILPLDFRQVRTGQVWEAIAVVQWIYGTDRFDAAVADVVKALNDVPQYRRTHTRLLERAREWSQQERDNALLLRGSELAAAEEWNEGSVGRSPAPSELQIEFIKASRSRENETRDGVLARRLANQAEVLFSEGAGMLERSLLVAVESIRRLPTLTAHRVLSRGLERLPVRLEPLPLPELYAVCGDSPILATVDGTNSLLLVDLLDKQVQRTVELDVGEITAFEHRSNSRLLLVWDGQEHAVIVDVRTGKTVINVESALRLHAQLNYAESHLMVLDESGHLRIFDLDTQKVLIDRSNDSLGSAAMIAFHDRFIAVQLPRQNVTIWTLPDLRKIAEVKLEELERIEFSPDGRRLLTVPTRGDNPRLWATESGNLLTHFAAHNWGVAAIAFRPDRGHLATASIDRTARLWDADGANIAVFEHETEVFGVNWSNDGSLVATTQKNGAVQLWDPLRRDFGSTPSDGSFREILGLSASPSANLLLTTVDSKLERWSFGPTSGPLSLLGRRNELLTSVAFSSDGRYLAALYEYHRLVVHDVRSGQVVGRFESPQDQDILLVSASPDPRYFLLHSQFTFLVEVPGFRVTPLKVGGIWEEIAWSRTGRMVAGQGQQRFGTVWSIPEDKALFEGNSIVWGIAISPGEEFVATVGQHAPLRLTRLDDRTTKEFTGHRGSTHSCAFSADGERVASGGEDSTARIWDVKSGNEEKVVSHADGGVRVVAFSPDDKSLATCGDDATVRVWSCASGQELFRGLHSSKVNCVRFDPSGRYLASGGDDMTARVWDLQIGEEIARFDHEEFVFGAHFSPDQKFITTLSAYGTRRVGRLWLWNPIELARQIQLRLPRSISDEERQYYLGLAE
jgi:WD40 repeat protein